MIFRAMKTTQLAVSSAAALTVFIASCALYNPQNSGKALLVKECVLPTDQSATLGGHWPILPVPIAVHQGDFDASEIADIAAAADTWNQFFKASKNLTLLDYGGSASNFRTSGLSNPNQSSIPLSAQPIIQGNQYIGNFVIYKMGRWPYSASEATVIAYTTQQYYSTPGLKTYYTGVMEINYQNFFVSGRQVPDLQTIVAHEFGHLAGLGHSCGPTSGNGIPGCNDTNLNPDYFNALMYTTFGFDASGAGERKRDLRSNDEYRANCLYTAPTTN